MLLIALTLLTLAGAWKWGAYQYANRFRGGTYRVGVDHNLPNYDWSETKGAFGFAVDVMNEAARMAGMKLEWVYCPQGALTALREGTIDLWPTGYYRPGEYPFLHQTRPWSEDQHTLVWDRGRIAEEPENWDGRRVAVTNRELPRALARRVFPKMEMVLAPTRRGVLNAMCAGEADVAFLDMRVVANALLDRPAGCAGTLLHVKPIPGLTDPMSLFARKEFGAVADVLRDRIEDMIAQGTVMGFAERWFSFTSAELRQVLRLQERDRQLGWLFGVCGAMGVAIALLAFLIRKLKAARAAADRARQLQAEFLANVSHEIRTPMNGVLGTADLLMATVENGEIREHIETIRESANGQLELLNQILDQSKIDSGLLLLETTPFSLRRLMEQVEKSFLPAARRKGIRLRAHVDEALPAMVQGDGLRVRQVLTNLVNNAIKFTPEGDVEIFARGFVLDRVANVEFTVTDTGIGIPKGALETIFEKFRQLDASTTRRYGGTGLGLSISRQLVRLMGGELTVDSEPGKGSRFRFTVPLPVARVAEQEAPVPLAKGIALAGLKVLVVDDNAVNRRVVQALLCMLGAQVEVAENGAEAVAKCREREFDAVLMDCQMPGMDGYTATAEIRKLDGAVRTVPIVALTAGVTGEERRRALESGMNGFLAKPVSRDDLASTLAPLPRRETSVG